MCAFLSAQPAYTQSKSAEVDADKGAYVFDLIKEAKMTKSQLDQAYAFLEREFPDSWYLSYERACVINNTIEFGSNLTKEQSFIISEKGSEIPFWAVEANVMAVGAPGDKYMLASTMFGHVAKTCRKEVQ